MVSEVIGRYLPLKRAGREYMALCPFHKEKTPSFTINNEKGFYHCFGCGAHGDVINFVKEYEGVGYREAIEKLAQEVGMALPQPSEEARQQDETIRTLQDVTEAACGWFQQQLTAAENVHVRDYLADRGIAPATMERFRIGFAPENGDGFQRAMLAEGFSMEQLVDAGLMIQVEGRNPYARFRDRVIFPIRDRYSKVVAFGGRILPGNSNPNAPKYLNSPETELFHKGTMLFNFDLARRPAMEQRSVVLCEGYMDVIALDQAGIHHVMAPLGTAVTDQQLKQLWMVCDTPVICLDGDAAGERAMIRLAELALPLLSPGKSLKFCTLPAGHDPDSYVRSYGAQEFLAMTVSALGLADTLWQSVSGAGAKTPEERAGQEAQLLRFADTIQHPSVRTHYKSYLKQKFWAPAKKSSAMQRTTGVGITQRHLSPPLPLPHLPKESTGQRRQDSAVQLLRLALLYPSILTEAESEEWLARLQFEDTRYDQLKQQVITTVCSYSDIDRTMLGNVISSPDKNDAYQTIMEDLQHNMPRKFYEDEENQYLPEARRMWRQAYNAYYAAGILEEFRQAESDMASDMSQEKLTRLMELKQELEKIELERGKIYRETLEETG